MIMFIYVCLVMQLNITTPCNKQCRNKSKLESLRRRLHQQRMQATIVTYNASLAACRSEDALSLLSEAETWPSGKSDLM